MAGYDRSKNADYTLAVQSALKTLGADLGGSGVDGKWGKYTEAAYRKNRAAVDRLVSEMGVSAAGAYGSGSRLAAEQINVPEQKGFDEWLSIGGALFAAQAEARKASAKRQLEVNRQQVEQARAQSAVTLENAANARGFGRSSYTANLLQRNENAARDNQTALMNNFSDALMQIDADQAASAAQFAGTMWKSQQDAALAAQKFNAQMRQESNLAQWKQDNADWAAAQKASASGSSGGRRRASGRRTEQETKAGGVQSLIRAGVQAVKGMRKR